MAVLIVYVRRGGRANVPGRWAPHLYEIRIRVPIVPTDGERSLYLRSYPREAVTPAAPPRST